MSDKGTNLSQAISSNRTAVYIGGGIVAGVVVLVCILICYYKCLKKSPPGKKANRVRSSSSDIRDDYSHRKSIQSATGVNSKDYADEESSRSGGRRSSMAQPKGQSAQRQNQVTHQTFDGSNAGAGHQRSMSMTNQHVLAGSSGMNGKPGMNGLTRHASMQSLSGMPGTIAMHGMPENQGMQDRQRMQHAQGMSGLPGMHGRQGMQAIHGQPGMQSAPALHGSQSMQQMLGMQAMNAMATIQSMSGMQGMANTPQGMLAMHGAPLSNSMYSAMQACSPQQQFRRSPSMQGFGPPLGVSASMQGLNVYSPPSSNPYSTQPMQVVSSPLRGAGNVMGQQQPIMTPGNAFAPTPSSQAMFGGYGNGYAQPQQQNMQPYGMRF